MAFEYIAKRLTKSLFFWLQQRRKTVYDSRGSLLRGGRVERSEPHVRLARNCLARASCRLAVL